MGKVYVRVDDRLVHGQTLMGWGPAYGTKEIIAIDDVSAKNPTLKTIMTMGIPKTYKGQVLTSEEANKVLSEKVDHTRLVIVKYPKVLEGIKDVIKDAEIIVLGNIAKREDTNHNLKDATGIFYLSDEDVKAIDGLVNSGLKVCFQQLPTTSMTTWEDFKKTL